MLDDLRRQADEVEYDELDSQELPGSVERDPDERFLGLTPIQRFFIALLLLVITILVGLLCLLVTGKIMPPAM
jgi:hypothetical protein